MSLDEVEAWWPFMLARERDAWFQRDGRSLGRATYLRLAKIPEDPDNPLSPEDEAGALADDDPEVRRWMKRLRRVLADMPASVFISMGYSSACVHAKVGDSCDHGPETEIGGPLPGTWRSS